LNAAKHAQARHVWIRMSQSEQRVGVEVRDDGRGFDPAPAGAKTDRGGFGMFSIRERVAALGGQMDVVSSRGRGAQVMIWVPRSQTERPAADTSK
jgi:signal transduction histidine kinase